MANEDYSEVFSDDNEVGTNWFKFDEVGTKIAGKFVSKRLQEGDGDFGDQMVYVLDTADGMWNVPISVNKEGTIQRANKATAGDIMGFEFEKEGEPKKKGYNAPKYIKVFVKPVDDEDKSLEDVADSFAE